jgi:capsid assembly protease
MNLIDVLTSPWAIVPDKLLEMQAVYATHLRGEKIDLDAVEARLGRPLANEQKAYQLQEGTGVAVLEISGVISPKANMFTRVSGGAAASMLQQQVQSMLADRKVQSVVLDMDTPGGNVLGIPALANAVRDLAAAKPTVAVSTGVMASAGYWIGSAANAIYMSGTTDVMGSIGVVATHSYDPRRSEVQTTEVTAGRYKRMASERSPLSPEGKAYMQAQVDEIYRVFVETVATNRRVDVEQVLSKMADGRIFTGQQAIDAGLADGVATVDRIVAMLDEDPGQFAQRRRATFAVGGLPKPAASISPASAPGAAAPVSSSGPVMPSAHPLTAGVTMTPQEQAAAFAAENPAAVALIRAEGAAAERDRVQAVRQQAIPGHEALIEQLAADGKTTGPEAAMAVLAAERQTRAAHAAARAAEAPKPVPQAPAGETDARPKLGAVGQINAAADLNALDREARAYMAANPGVAYVAAVKAVQAQD